MRSLVPPSSAAIGRWTSSRSPIRAGLTADDFRQLFTSKDQCLLAAFDGFLARLYDQIDEDCEEVPDWPTKVRVAIESAFSLVAELEGTARLFVVDAIRTGEAGSSAIAPRSTAPLAFSSRAGSSTPSRPTIRRRWRDARRRRRDDGFEPPSCRRGRPAPGARARSCRDGAHAVSRAAAQRAGPPPAEKRQAGRVPALTSAP